MAEVKSEMKSPARGPRSVDAEQKACVIGREISFEGILRSKEDLIILGAVKGSVEADSNLVVGREAQIDADIRGERVTVNGRVGGNIRCSERVEIGPSAQVQGDISAPAVEIHEGAMFEGRVRRPGKGRKNDSLWSRLWG